MGGSPSKHTPNTPSSTRGGRPPKSAQKKPSEKYGHNPSRWGYHPEQHGAQCSRCSLKERMVVPSELRSGSVMTVVAEAPGKWEESLGWPLVGRSGEETERALEECGLRRRDVSIVNVMCCRAPGNNYEGHLRVLSTLNKQRVAAGKEPLLKPHEACLPRLLREIQNARALLLMGKYARRAALDLDEPPLEDEDKEQGAVKEAPERIPGRGFPGVATIGGRDIPCLSTVHPAFVLRARRWTRVFRSDVAKAKRMADGALEWTKPRMLFFPNPQQLKELLDSFGPGEIVSYDVETDGLQPTECNLRCVGIGTKDVVTCIPFRSVENDPKWVYTREEKREIVDILTKFFADPSGIIAPQNGKYDYAVMRNCGHFPGFEIKRRVFDTAVAHHVAHSEWPHDLDFLIAQYTDAPHHKGKDHDKWQSDEELHLYCMLDVSRTAEVAGYLLREPALQAQKVAFSTDNNTLSPFCRQLGETGIGLNVAERDRLFRVQTDIMYGKQKVARELSSGALERVGGGTPGARKLIEELNPNSYQQVGQVLYEVLGVEPAPEKAGGYTETGALSTSSDVLYYLMDRGLPDLIERFLLSVIDYRAAQKLRGTYCTVQPCRDGRVRPSWNPHVVVSGRLSCSDPNLLNLERSIRSMYVPSEGNLLVSCDKRQQEIRAVTWLSRDLRWLEAIAAGADLHRVNACDLLGIASPEKVSKAQRQFTKTFVFAIQYLAGVRKAWQMIRNFVDPKTRERPYRKRTLGEISLCYRRFWETHEAILKFHERNRKFWEDNGYLADALHGRRRYFLDGEGDENVKEELANYLIQTVSASDMNDAIQRAMDEFPPGYAGPNTGIVLYVYDALTLEAPAHRALKDGARLAEIMYSKHDDMEFPVDLSIGSNYGKKTEYVQLHSGEWIEDK